MSQAEYDRRRPRIPVALGAAIDEVRGQVSYNRFIVSRLADALGVELADVMRVPKDPPKPKAKKRVTPTPKAKAKPKPAVTNGRVDDARGTGRPMSSAEAKAAVFAKHAARKSQRRDKS